MQFYKHSRITFVLLFCLRICITLFIRIEPNDWYKWTIWTDVRAWMWARIFCNVCLWLFKDAEKCSLGEVSKQAKSSLTRFFAFLHFPISHIGKTPYPGFDGFHISPTIHFLVRTLWVGRLNQSHFILCASQNPIRHTKRAWIAPSPFIVVSAAIFL